MFLRVEVATRPEFPDPQAQQVVRKIELALPSVRRLIRWARVVRVYWLEVPVGRELLIPAVSEIFWDPVTEWLFTGDLIPSAADRHGGVMDLVDSCPFRSGKIFAIERRFRPGVTDNEGRTIVEALGIVLERKVQEMRAASGAYLLMEGPELTDQHLEDIARNVFCNELVESWSLRTLGELSKSDRFHPDLIQTEFPKVHLRTVSGGAAVQTYALDKMSLPELEKMSHKSLWALNGAELSAIQNYFKQDRIKAEREKRGLGLPTDVEMEVIAQTWSEHCKHKIFNAKIHYEEMASEAATVVRTPIPAQIQSLFRETIFNTTKELHRPWLLSVFDDNAGIVAFDDVHAVCIKVETHNSPSALDPYGGALTGIVGVNRDILGAGLGAKPIFNTDVFCLATPDTHETLPDRLLHPRRILEGVRRGVEHGGNKSGIPTVNGALVFDQRYLGKPLIYCGTGGIIPREILGRPCQSKEVQAGDLIFMIGGRIGKDGIHGATFSSLALDEFSPSTAVQLGDPITQKRVSDFLMEARDLGLYRSLTDNGAGGLSSSVGEMARIPGGARMDVANALTKYPGLKPYELVISESQERMTVAVPPENRELFSDLAARRTVEVSVLGEFTNSGYLEILYQGKHVGALELEFLHKGVPQMEIQAKWQTQKPKASKIQLSFEKDGPKKLLDLLARPNIASKEWLIRQYDHEVQGSSVIKPLVTSNSGGGKSVSGPNDASVIRPKPDTWKGVAVGCGINPKLSDYDPYLMAQSAVDEAIRNILSVGAEFGSEESVISLVDNFCWPDPVSNSRFAGALVRACFGLRDAALALGVPLVSGKDSMKNDYRGKLSGKEIQISVPPTLLMTAVGRVPDIRNARTSDYKGIGDRIYLLGKDQFGLLGSEYHQMLKEDLVRKGGSQDSVVLPSASEEEPRYATPDWDLAVRVYSWLGGTEGKKQALLRSVHDVSEGGLLVSVAESLFPRGFGAELEIADGGYFKRDPWEFAFGEGFHAFVISATESDSTVLEDEWRTLDIPFLSLGRVTGNGRLKVSRRSMIQKGDFEAFEISTQELLTAWNREGYWE